MVIYMIANGKTNVLDFGSDEMTFYRGEIHMIIVNIIRNMTVRCLTILKA